MKPVTNQRGFTLIEIIIAMAIFAILAAIAVPNFNVWRQNSQLRSDVRLILGALQQARVEAITRNQPVTITFDNSWGLKGDFTNIQFIDEKVTFSARGFADFFGSDDKKCVSFTSSAGTRTVILKAAGHASILPVGSTECD
ncbi:GspH/FimT family pseudopilin [Pelobacter sp. M08fum]|uniref:Type II secretion system protein H n=1 Tax=Pelovirga terrestris TaxID=2771352 RepID=A0A8J6UHJ4_9BACT|nr:GspH/FimT family pseudopilin [Pelovirga terrestris]